MNTNSNEKLLFSGALLALTELAALTAQAPPTAFTALIALGALAQAPPTALTEFIALAAPTAFAALVALPALHKLRSGDCIRGWLIV